MYKVITSIGNTFLDGKEMLEKEVNEEISKGWRTSGSMSVTQRDANTRTGRQYLFAQPMEKGGFFK